MELKFFRFKYRHNVCERLFPLSMKESVFLQQSDKIKIRIFFISEKLSEKRFRIVPVKDIELGLKISNGC